MKFKSLKNLYVDLYHPRAAERGVVINSLTPPINKMAHSYENFMGNKDFHPGSLRNLRKVHHEVNNVNMRLLAGMGGQGAIKNGREEAGGVTPAVL